MEENIQKMKEEQKERIKRIEELQQSVENTSGGGLFSNLGKAIDSVLPVAGSLLGGLFKGKKK